MKIAAVGDNCIDLYDNWNKVYMGGNPVNVAVYTMRMGGSASYTGVVGNDKYGRLMIDTLQEKGVDISHVRIEEGKTAITHIELMNGDRVFGKYEEGVLSNFRLTEADIEFLCTHDMVVTGIWGMTENYLDRIRAKGIPIAFDFSTEHSGPIVEKAVSNVDYAFFSYEGKGNDDIKDFMEKMHIKGPKIIVVTLGENGSLAYDGREFVKYGIIPCKVIDTLGAGDSYIAGFLHGVLNKKTLEECMAMGAASSSVTIGYIGAW